MKNNLKLMFLVIIENLLYIEKKWLKEVDLLRVSVEVLLGVVLYFGYIINCIIRLDFII